MEPRIVLMVLKEGHWMLEHRGLTHWAYSDFSRLGFDHNIERRFNVVILAESLDSINQPVKAQRPCSLSHGDYH
jgi:hypothetical protein